MKNPIADWLKDALAATDLSQTELARRLNARLATLNMTPQKVSLMTKGKREISYDEVNAISAVLGVKPPSVMRSSTIAIGSAPSSIGPSQGAATEIKTTLGEHTVVTEGQSEDLREENSRLHAENAELRRMIGVLTKAIEQLADK